jgi:hypothetical protein
METLQVDGLVQRRNNRDTLFLVEVYDLLSDDSKIYKRTQLNFRKDTTTRLTRSGDTEALIHLLIRSRGPPTLETVLFMRILLPPEGLNATVSDTSILNINETHRESLDRQYGSAAPEHAQLVALLLPIEDRPRGEGDNPGLDSLPLEFRSSLEGDGNLTSATDNCEVLTLHLVDDVSTLGRPLDRRPLEVGKVLARKGKDGGGGL